jgi:hypothetical protein
MSSATERAEARRKAILARRGDRLAKLTTTARGDEAVFLNDGVYRPLARTIAHVLQIRLLFRRLFSARTRQLACPLPHGSLSLLLLVPLPDHHPQMHLRL